MDLIYIFDNYCFNNFNSIIFNTIKRWILYELLNLISTNKYDNIILIKTGPSMSSCKINLHNNISITKLILLINNIIYKKYDIYPTINLKNIFNELKNYSTTNSKIIIFTSIYKPGLEEKQKKYINNILEKFNNNICFYNVSKYPSLEKKFNNIQEIFINHKMTLIVDIIYPEIFSIKQIDFTIQENIINQTNIISKLLNYFDDNLNILDTNNLDNHDTDILIENYLKIMYKIELLLVNNVVIQSDSELNNYINRFFTLPIDTITNNKTLINQLNYFKNIIKNLFDKNNNTCLITIPDISLTKPDNTDNTDNTIKYIIEFYKEIYPKLIKFHLDFTKKFRVPKVTTKQIIIENINKISRIEPENISDDSLQYFVSNTTMSNWVDEFNEFNPFGILIKYTISKHSYKGLIDEYSSILYSYPNTIINSVSNNWISLFDYYQMIRADLNNVDPNEDYLNNNNTNKEQFDLNNFNIIDNLNGDTNIMLPMYICKTHWELTRNLWSYHIAFINSTFEYEYNKKMDNIYYLTLLKCFNSLTTNTNFNNNFIRLFICLLRTCIQITIDNKYMQSIVFEVDKYFNNFTSISNPNNPNNKYDNIKNIFIDYLIRLLQLIVSSNSQLDKVKSQLVCIRNIIISLHIDSFYDSNYWKNLTEENKIYAFNIIKTECVQYNKSWFQLEHDLICLCEFVNQLYKIKNFNQFIKNIDACNSCIPQTNIPQTNIINCELLTNIFNNLTSNKIFNIDDYIDKIEIKLDDYLINNVVK